MPVPQNKAREPFRLAAGIGRCCALSFCLLVFSSATDAQTYVRKVEIGVIPQTQQPLSPSPDSRPKRAPPAAGPAPKVMDIHGQPVGFDTGHADMAHHVIVENFGGGAAGEQKAEAAQQSATGLTANMSSLLYRVSRIWDGSAFDAIAPSSDPNAVSPSAPAASTRFFTASAGVASEAQQRTIMSRWDNDPPGGVMLEGAFDPGALQSVVYDARYHALILDTQSGGRVVYLSIAAHDVETLCHAIAGDDQMRVGVSLSRPPRSYGALVKDSNVALNMFVGDGLLGAIAFGPAVDSHDMIADFRLAGDFAPRTPGHDIQPMSVGFTFRTESYHDDGKSLTPDGNALDILFTPLAPSGGHYVAAMSTDAPQEWVENIQHISDNLDYYREEPIVTLIFRYAQTASLLRGLKSEGVDLEQLADGIAFATGESK